MGYPGEEGGRAGADNQIRCNQIWAVSMAFSMLSPEKEKQVVETVAEKLYTPYGLRTLSEDEKEFRPFTEAASLTGIWRIIRVRSGYFRWADTTCVSEGAWIQQEGESGGIPPAGGFGRRHAGRMRRTAS